MWCPKRVRKSCRSRSRVARQGTARSNEAPLGRSMPGHLFRRNRACRDRRMLCLLGLAAAREIVPQGVAEHAQADHFRPFADEDRRRLRRTKLCRLWRRLHHCLLTVAVDGERATRGPMGRGRSRHRLGSGRRHPVPAETYIAQGKETDGNPSLRYITLMREGARAHGLPDLASRPNGSLANGSTSTTPSGRVPLSPARRRSRLTEPGGPWI